LLPLVEPAGRHRRVAIDVCRRPAPEDLVDAQDSANPRAPRAPLLADPEQLRQLFLNLTLNGVEAAGPGGSVRIEWFGTATDWHVCVFDSGPGPPQQLVERLFEAFVTSKPEGVGLGLAVARQIAEAHGGTLVYRREEHTCFELILPRGGAASAGTSTADPASRSAGPALPPVALQSPVSPAVRP